MKKPQLFAAVFALAALAVGCNRSSAPDENSRVSATNLSSMSATQQWQSAKEVATNAWQNTKEATTNALESMKQSVQSAADYTYDKKDVFVAKASADMDALDQKIKELSDKTTNATDSVKADAQPKLQDLHAQRAALDKKLDDVKNATEANWNEVKTAFQNSYDDVKNSLKQAWQWLTDKMSS